jgi:hypothetical protein
MTVEKSKTLPCPTCSHTVSRRAKSCPSCGDPLAARGITKSHRKVSALWTLLLGFIYFLAEGWVKSAIAALVVSLLTGGIGWLIIPLCAQSFVDAIEG